MKKPLKLCDRPTNYKLLFFLLSQPVIFGVIHSRRDLDNLIHRSGVRMWPGKVTTLTCWEYLVKSLFVLIYGQIE